MELSACLAQGPLCSSVGNIYGAESMSHPTSGRVSDGREGQLPFPVRGRKRTELLSAQPSPSRLGQQGVCPLHKPPPSVSYAGSGLEARCFEGQDHTDTPAIPGTLLIICVCPGVWLLLGRSHPAHGARWAQTHSPGICRTWQGRATRAVNSLINSWGITFLLLSGRCAWLNREQHRGVALFVDTVGLHAVHGLCQVGNPSNILVTWSY